MNTNEEAWIFEKHPLIFKNNKPTKIIDYFEPFLILQGLNLIYKRNKLEGNNGDKIT